MQHWCYVFFCTLHTFTYNIPLTACNWTVLDEIRVFERRHHRHRMTKCHTFVMDDGDEASTTQHERVHGQLARLMAGGKVDPDDSA